MATRDEHELDEIFSELTSISDDEIYDGVVRGWTRVREETNKELKDVPHSPTLQRKLDLPDLTLVEHINDVAIVSRNIVDAFEEKDDIDISRDIVIAGALIHDISKPYEYDETKMIDEIFEHPYFGISLATDAGLPLEVVHIVLSHTPRTPVQPKTLEAEIVARADKIAATSLRMKGTEGSLIPTRID